ncbi:MAG: aldo/keto reductase, partial [Actinomycetota bacterium]
LYCHRADPNTPLEETVRAMSDIVDAGKATYWGTSEWSADEIRAAIEIADKRNLHAPVTEQSQYNLLERTKVEVEYHRLWTDHRYGNTIWSPLKSGLLTGKYADGIPSDSRGALPGYEWLADQLKDPRALEKVEKLRPIAERLDCSLAQLSIAWATKHPMVSSVITGASKVKQVRQNFAALDVIPKLTDDVMAEIDASLA